MRFVPSITRNPKEEEVSVKWGNHKGSHDRPVLVLELIDIKEANVLGIA